MTPTRIALVALVALALLSLPVVADDQASVEDESPCPAVQVTPWDPYVSVQPDCLPPGPQPQP